MEIKVEKPKQIAGRGVTRKDTLPPGITVTKPNEAVQTNADYGVICKILWKKSYTQPHIETIKILSENEWNVDAIDCAGTKHERLSKSDFILLDYVDKMEVFAVPPMKKGCLWRIANKKKLMEGKTQVIRVVDDGYGQAIDYIDENGTEHTRMWLSDMIFLGIVSEEDCPEALKITEGEEK
jgi:hypothetical protein